MLAKDGEPESIGAKLQAIEPEEIEKKVSAAVDTAVKKLPLQAAPGMTPDEVHKEVEMAWTEVVKGGKKKPGIIPMTTIIKEQIQQQVFSKKDPRSLQKTTGRYLSHVYFVKLWKL